MQKRREQRRGKKKRDNGGTIYFKETGRQKIVVAENRYKGIPGGEP